MLIIGESLNASIAKVGQAIQSRDDACIAGLAREQKEVGAQMLEKVLPVVAEHGCSVVALCLGEKGIPHSTEARFEVASRLVERAREAGLKPEDIYVDPLVLSIGADWQAGRVCLDTLRLIRDRLPGVHIIGGISNVSFGMPSRPLLNATFLAMAIGLGMDSFLVNVRQRAVMATLLAANLLAGNDSRCVGYLRAYRAGRLKA